MRIALNERAQLCEQLRDENERLHRENELTTNRFDQMQHEYASKEVVCV